MHYCGDDVVRAMSLIWNSPDIMIRIQTKQLKLGFIRPHNFIALSFGFTLPVRAEWNLLRKSTFNRSIRLKHKTGKSERIQNTFKIHRIYVFMNTFWKRPIMALYSSAAAIFASYWLFRPLDMVILSSCSLCSIFSSFFMLCLCLSAHCWKIKTASIYLMVDWI